MEPAELLDTERRVLKSLLSLMTANPFGARHAAVRQTLVARGLGPYRPVNLAGGFPWRVNEARLILEDPSCGKRQLAPEDRRLARRALLVVLFHLYAERFDAYIDRVEQLAGGEETPSVDFADEVWDYLRGHRFIGPRRLLSEPEAAYDFALLYQLCRAGRFINRGLVGECPSMRRLRMKLWNNVFTHDLWQYAECLRDRMKDFSLLILGGTGSGKGTAARAIGFSGFIPFDRRRRCFARSFRDTFVPVVLAQYPESLIESAIFGHVAGAFTGATDARDGVLDRCVPGGTVFLDEIGEVKHHVQVKLLQVLQERQYTPVGGAETRSFEGRVIAATNRPAENLLGKDALRADFFYRLCSDVIEMPSLRQRIDEDPDELHRMLLHAVRGTLGTAASEAEAARLAAQIAECLHRRLGPDHDWPGNVRELEQCVRSYLIRKSCGPAVRALGGSDATVVPPGPAQPRVPETLHPLIAAIRDRTITRDELLTEYSKWVYRAEGSYKGVARILGLKDTRTVKRYMETPTTDQKGTGNVA